MADTFHIHSTPAPFPHERLDVYAVLVAAYEAVMSWPGLATARGSAGDQLQRALSSALLQYAEGFYATAGSQPALWSSARASCGEAATAVELLRLQRRVGTEPAAAVRQLLSRAMALLTRLSRRA